MRRALYRLYASVRARPLLRQIEQLERSQWLPREEVIALQASRLRTSLEAAARDVPYYKELLRKEGLDPSRVRGAEDLRALPLLDRDTLQARLADLRSSAPGPDARERTTGGSTGRRLSFLVDRDEMTARSAHIVRGLRWLGWEPGDRIAYVWGSDIDAREHRGVAGRVRDALVGVLWLDAFRLDRKDLDHLLGRLESFEPAVVIGYPSSLHLLAGRALESGRKLALRGVETSAEALTAPVRRDLESAFGCQVLDRYGCREAGVIAHECEKGSLHVNAEAVVVETVDGEVVITTLNNRSMPLVRYRVEDLAETSDEVCACGRGLPLLRRLSGRVSDIIRSPSGRLIHGEFFTHLFYDAAGVKRFQVEQTSLERLEIRYVAEGQFDGTARAGIERAIREHGDAAFVVNWVPVVEIPPGPSGKFRFTISSLSSGGRTG